MGMAAGLIRLRSDEDPIPCRIPPGRLTLVDLPQRVWKTRVELSSLLIVSVPVVAQVLPPLPLLPQLNLLAYVLLF